jgi:phosphotransferase system HPr (HPr) family protein
MNGETLQRRVVITNPQGFHMRPQSTFVRRANQFASAVTVAKGQVRANGKSQWELMLLAADQGAELLLEVTGPDAAAALDALTEVLAAPAPEDFPEPPLPKKG